MVSLLLKESDVVPSGYALTDFHAIILLQILLASASAVHRRAQQTGVTSADSEACDELNRVLNKNLLALFTRFQDTEENLLILASFLELLEFSNTKTLQLFLKTTSGLFLRCQSEALLYRLANSWRKWASETTADEAITAGKAQADSIARTTELLWESISSATVLFEATSDAESSKKKKRMKDQDKVFENSTCAQKDIVLIVLLAASLGRRWYPAR